MNREMNDGVEELFPGIRINNVILSCFYEWYRCVQPWFGSNGTYI
jgi:hypothetical protein